MGFGTSLRPSAWNGDDNDEKIQPNVRLNEIFNTNPICTGCTKLGL